MGCISFCTVLQYRGPGVHCVQSTRTRKACWPPCWSARRANRPTTTPVIPIRTRTLQGCPHSAPADSVQLTRASPLASSRLIVPAVQYRTYPRGPRVCPALYSSTWHMYVNVESADGGAYSLQCRTAVRFLVRVLTGPDRVRETRAGDYWRDTWWNCGRRVLARWQATLDAGIKITRRGVFCRLLCFLLCLP